MSLHLNQQCQRAQKARQHVPPHLSGGYPLSSLLRKRRRPEVLIAATRAPLRATHFPVNTLPQFYFNFFALLREPMFTFGWHARLYGTWDTSHLAWHVRARPERSILALKPPDRAAARDRGIDNHGGSVAAPCSLRPSRHNEGCHKPFPLSGRL